MKKLIVLCMVAFMAITVKAQFYVGGTLGASYGKVEIEDESTDYTKFMIAPEFGYQIDKCLSVGASFGFGYNKQEDDTNTAFMVEPYIRAIFAQAKGVKFFAEGALFLNHNKFEIESSMPGYDYSFNTWGAAVRPGFLVNVGKNLNLIGKATFLQYTKSEKDDIDTKTWQIGIPNEFTVGILYNF